jgi:hypothetical protein
MNAFRSCGLLAIAMSLLCATAAEAGQVRQKKPIQIPGQSLDDGLGDLPHYAHWADPTGRMSPRINIPGETLDSGLGAFVDQLEREFNEPMQVGTAPANKSATRRK